MLLRTSIPLTYLIFTYLKTLPTLLYLKSKMHRERIQNKSISWDIPRVGGMRSVVLHWTTIGWQEVLKIGKYSRAKSKLLSNHSLTSKFKKLLTKNKNLGSSWTRSINTNCLPSKPSSIVINNVLISMTCRILFIPHLIWLSIIRLMLGFLMESLTNQPPLGSCFQEKNSGSL